MRHHYYRFPEDSDVRDRVIEGCEVILKDGTIRYYDDIDEFLTDYDRVDCVTYVVHASLKVVKALIKRYGGTGWTEHYERDGTLFEVTKVKMDGNNSRVKYNHHL